MTFRPPADLLANAQAPIYIHSLIYILRFLLEKVGLKCHSDPKDSPRGLVRRKYGRTDNMRAIKLSRIRTLGHLYRYADAFPTKKVTFSKIEGTKRTEDDHLHQR
ncbi:hypothetical protein TNCV_1514191 [Trichonephila clavipes]|nr:hypothetical protein TNCV_1514191 [Trichonephila clavipes]